MPRKCDIPDCPRPQAGRPVGRYDGRLCVECSEEGTALVPWEWRTLGSFNVLAHWCDDMDGWLLWVPGVQRRAGFAEQHLGPPDGERPPPAFCRHTRSTARREADA